MSCASQKASAANDTGVLFYTALGMWIVGRLCKSLAIAQDLASFSQILTFSSLALLVIFELTKLDVNRLVSWLPFTALLLLVPSAIQGQDTVLFQGILFAVCARHCRFEIAAKVFLVVILTVTIGAIVLSLVGVIPNNMVYVTGRTRMSLGFVWPSRAPNLLLTATCLYVYLKRDRLSVTSIILFGIAAYGLYALTESRNPFVFTMVLLVLAFAIQKLNLLNSPSAVAKVIPLIFVFCAVVSVGLCWAYDSSISWMRELNILTTRRFFLSHLAFESSPISLWGTDFFLDADSETEGFLDSSYLQLWFYYGLVAFVAVVTFWTVLLKRALNNGNRYLVVILICIALHSVLEGQLLVLEYTPFMLLFFAHEARHGASEPICLQEKRHRKCLSEEHARIVSRNGNSI